MRHWSERGPQHTKGLQLHDMMVNRFYHLMQQAVHHEAVEDDGLQRLVWWSTQSQGLGQMLLGSTLLGGGRFSVFMTCEPW